MYLRRGDGEQLARELATDFVTDFFVIPSEAAPHGYRFQRYDPARGERFRSYVYQAAANHRIDHDRKHRGQLTGRATAIPHQFPDQFDPEELDPTADPEQVFNAAWAQGVFARAIGVLRARQREKGWPDGLFDALLAHVWDDPDAVPYADLSARFGKSAGSLRVDRTRLCDALEGRLAEELATEGATDAGLREAVAELLSVLSC